MPRRIIISISVVAVLLVAAVVAIYSQPSKGEIPTHKNISATIFWVGETATADNAYIPNKASAWDDHWLEHFCNPRDNVCWSGNGKTTLEPRENQFYFALPYSEFDAQGKLKPNASKIYWFDPKKQPLPEGKSALKNMWVKISAGKRVAYAQWEDVGPFKEDDVGYVFGESQPQYRKAGIDLSPTTASYLGIDGLGRVNWKFIDARDVPAGPWKKIVTTSQLDRG